MSSLKRETILARLQTILQQVKTDNPTLIKTFVRNRAPLDTDKRPAVVLLDGDERQRLTRDRLSGRGDTRPVGPQIMQMQPQIVFVLEEKKGDDELKGTQLNTLRTLHMDAIGSDATLRAAVGSNGSIVFNGSTTDLKTGGAVSGQMLLDYSFFYALIT